MKRTLLLSCAIGLSAISSVSAANIAWVTMHSGDNSPTPNASGVGFTQAPDVGYTNFLTANGNTVTRIVATAAPIAALLNGFDLVIIGRSNISTNFENAGATAWNSITAPTIIMSGYLARSSRLGFATGTTMRDTFLFNNSAVDSVRLKAANPLSPVFSGIALDGTNTMTGNFASEVTFGVNVQQGISANLESLTLGASIIATVGSSTAVGDTTLNLPIIAEWNAGATMSNTAANVLGGKRLVFLSGSREQAITNEGAGIFDLDADGQKMLLNAVNYMAVPEPSTLSLAGFGLIALLRRRRA